MPLVDFVAWTDSIATVAMFGERLLRTGEPRGVGEGWSDAVAATVCVCHINRANLGGLGVSLGAMKL